MTTLISNVTELRNWLDAPIGTGQLTTNITINATTWVAPSGILTSGIILDGNGKTIFLQNVSGVGYDQWPGLLKINGGIVQNLRMSGAQGNNAGISPLASGVGNSYFSNQYFVGPGSITATYNNVWFDGCESNYLYFWETGLSGQADNVSVFGGYGDPGNMAVTSNITLNNCQVGRSKSNPLTKNGGNYAGFAMGSYTNFTVNNSVFFVKFNGGSDIATICGTYSTGTINKCIIYAYVQNYGSYCAILFGGRNMQNLYANDTYILIDWAVNGASGGYAIPVCMNEDQAPPIGFTYELRITRNYTLINLVGSGAFANNNPGFVMAPYQRRTKVLDGVGWTRNFFYGVDSSGNENLRALSDFNSTRTYTSTTPNTSLPVSYFTSSTTGVWNTTYTPPLLVFNSSSPWASTFSAYDQPNPLDFIKMPVINWVPNPSSLDYPAPLTSAQLNAQAYQVDGVTPLDGTFVYVPVDGTVLYPGLNRQLNTTFTPTSPSYDVATSVAFVNIIASGIPPIITWNPSLSTIDYPTPLGNAQLNAEAFELDGTTPLAGTFNYTPPSGTVLSGGLNQTLNTTFTSGNPAYANGIANAQVSVLYTPNIVWNPSPSTLIYPTALSSAQLNAQALQIDNTTPVAGFFSYLPSSGTVLDPGLNQTLHTTFISTDPIYKDVNGNTLVSVVNNPVITWNPSPSTITYPTPLGNAQLNAQAFETDGTTPLAGTFVYTPPSGTVLSAGLNQVLNTTFTPTSNVYANANANALVSVLDVPVITWSPSPNFLYNTQPLGNGQLNAQAFESDGTTPLPGTFTYTPPLGSVLSLGNNQPLNLLFVPSSSLYENAIANTTVNVIPQINNAVLTWTPSPSTLFYPAPLSGKQLNAQAFATDGVTPLPGTFTYTPPGGTVLDPGNSQVISTSFRADDYSYFLANANASVSVIPSPFMYIFNQQDLYNFLYVVNATNVVKGIMYNNIDIDVTTWVTDRASLPRSLGAGRILDGNGYTINLVGTISSPWYGLVYMGGGTIRNLTVDRTSGNDIIPVQSYGIIAGQNESGTMEFTVAISTRFNLSGASGDRGVFVGTGCNFTFNSCQAGTQAVPLTIGKNNTGLFAATNFQGSFNNCLVYVTNDGNSTGLNGGFIGSTGGAVTFTKCKAQGILADTVNGQEGGYVGIANHKVTFDNCYSIVDVFGVGPNKGGGFVGGCTNTNTQLYFNNCFYYGTAGTSGTLVNADINPFVISLYNVTTNGAYLSSASVNTNVVKNMVIQPWNNETTQTGVSGTVYATVKIGTDIYIGGDFTSVNGDATIQYLARWDTVSETWNQVGGGAINGSVYSLAVLSSTLYIGGVFTAPSSRITTWNGTSFTAISADTFDAAVRVVYPESATSVFIGGDFLLLNGATTMRHISRWDGTAWSEFGGGLNNDVFAIIGAGSLGTVYVGGKFTGNGNSSTTLNRICYYDGTSFQSIGSGTPANAGVNSDVNTLLMSGTTLYLGGEFTKNNLVSPTTLNRWAQWDTSSLTNPISVIGTGSIGFDNDVYQIIVNGGVLYVVGQFVRAGSSTFNNRYVARYDPSATQPWSSVSNFFNGAVRSILYDATLGVYWVGGAFTQMRDQSSNTVISNLNRVAQITETYNKTNYTGTSSTSTIPVLDFNNYFTS